MSKTKSITEALVIVDMQEWFINEVPKGKRAVLVKGILREIATAKSKRLPIVCLQYADLDCGFDSDKECWEYCATITEIRKALKGYSRAYYIWKDNDGGGQEVLDTLTDKHGPRLGCDKPSWRGKANPYKRFITDIHKMVDFTVCGVNSDACVASTCAEMVDAGHKCRVPADASANVFDGCQFADEGTDLMDADGVRVIMNRRRGKRKVAA